MNKFVEYLKNIDEIDLKIMKKGLKFSFILLAFSICVLLFYLLSKNNLFLYNFGLSLFKVSTYFGIEFIVCGVVVDTIKKEFNK